MVTPQTDQLVDDGQCWWSFVVFKGRIKQLIEMEALSTSSIRLFVLDEADKLLEDDSSSSFQEQIK